MEIMDSNSFNFQEMSYSTPELPFLCNSPINSHNVDNYIQLSAGSYENNTMDKDESLGYEPSLRKKFKGESLSLTSLINETNPRANHDDRQLDQSLCVKEGPSITSSMNLKCNPRTNNENFDQRICALKFFIEKLSPEELCLLHKLLNNSQMITNSHNQNLETNSSSPCQEPLNKSKKSKKSNNPRKNYAMVDYLSCLRDFILDCIDDSGGSKKYNDHDYLLHYGKIIFNRVFCGDEDLRQFLISFLRFQNKNRLNKNNNNAGRKDATRKVKILMNDLDNFNLSSIEKWNTLTEIYNFVASEFKDDYDRYKDDLEKFKDLYIILEMKYALSKDEQEKLLQNKKDFMRKGEQSVMIKTIIPTYHKDKKNIISSKEGFDVELDYENSLKETTLKKFFNSKEVLACLKQHFMKKKTSEGHWKKCYTELSKSY